MASSPEALEKVLKRLQELEEVTFRKMMGEYLLYHNGILFGGIYDDRLLLKDVGQTGSGMFERQRPYEHAKEMLLIPEELDDSILTQVILEMEPFLKEGKSRKSKKKQKK